MCISLADSAHRAARQDWACCLFVDASAEPQRGFIIHSAVCCKGLNYLILDELLVKYKRQRHKIRSSYVHSHPQRPSPSHPAQPRR